MALGSLANVPGLAGYLDMQRIQQQRSLGDLQGAVGMLGAMQRQQELEQAAQMAPIKKAFMEAQAAAMQRKVAEDQAVADAISKLDPKDQALARLAPGQYVSGQFKAPPPQHDMEKLIGLRDRYVAEGRHADAEIINNLLNNRQAGGSSTPERAFNTLSRLQQKIDSGAQLTPEEQRDGAAARAILSRQEMTFDPVTQQPVFKQPITIPGQFTAGGGAPAQPGATVNAVPPSNQGRRNIESGPEKELTQSGDLLSAALGLQKAFKDEYGGWKSDTVAHAVQEVGRRFNNAQLRDAANFWESYNQWVIDVRHGKFGATLTGNELRAFNQMVARPSQDPEKIKDNLAKQVNIAEKAMSRRMNTQVQQGVNPAAVEAAVGWGRGSAPVVNPRGTQGVVVNTPAGSFSFPDQRSADEFRKAAGIQ